MNQEIQELLLARHHKEKGYNSDYLIDILVELVKNQETELYDLELAKEVAEDDLFEAERAKERFIEKLAQSADYYDDEKDLAEVVKELIENYQ